MSKPNNFRTDSRGITDDYGIEVIALTATYVSNANKRALVMDGSQSCGVEEYACRHFSRLGYRATFLENRPIHVLFATYMWPVVQDRSDRRTRKCGFLDRDAYDAGRKSAVIWTRLPIDFGKPEYAIRRAGRINDHMAALATQQSELLDLFNRWLGPSHDLRNYLWAHRPEHIQVARQLIDVVPADRLIELLRYLIEHYWYRYAGWPDLLVSRDKEFQFVEVKSAGDKLGAAQERWIAANQQRLHLPFRLLKILPAAIPAVESAAVTQLYGGRRVT
jgi:hypothetical protein